MGTAMSRARAGIKPHGMGGAPRAPPKPRPANDVPARPPPPEARRVIEPGQDPEGTGDWDPKSPMYASLVQQVVAKISTVQHPTEGALKGRRDPTLPSYRRTDVSTGLMEGAGEAAPGKLSISQLRGILREQQRARAAGGGGGPDVRELARRHAVDAGTLERVLRHVSLVKELEREPPAS